MEEKRKIYHVVCFDPLTSAVFILDEIECMINEMFEAGRRYIGIWGRQKIMRC